jgi:hypothetical protein
MAARGDCCFYEMKRLGDFVGADHPVVMTVAVPVDPVLRSYAGLMG